MARSLPFLALLLPLLLPSTSSSWIGRFGSSSGAPVAPPGGSRTAGAVTAATTNASFPWPVGVLGANGQGSFSNAIYDDEGRVGVAYAKGAALTVALLDFDADSRSLAPAFLQAVAVEGLVSVQRLLLVFPSRRPPMAVVLARAAGGKGVLAAVAMATGSTKWSAALARDPVDCVQVGNELIAVLFADGSVAGFDAHDGQAAFPFVSTTLTLPDAPWLPPTSDAFSPVAISAVQGGGHHAALLLVSTNTDIAVVSVIGASAANLLFTAARGRINTQPVTEPMFVSGTRTFLHVNASHASLLDADALGEARWAVELTAFKDAPPSTGFFSGFVSNVATSSDCSGAADSVALGPAAVVMSPASVADGPPRPERFLFSYVTNGGFDCVMASVDAASGGSPIGLDSSNCALRFALGAGDRFAHIVIGQRVSVVDVSDCFRARWALQITVPYPGIGSFAAPWLIPGPVEHVSLVVSINGVAVVVDDDETA